MSDEQQVITDCVYCTRVRPEASGGCPFCGGRRSLALPAQMMDERTSRASVIRELFEAGAKWHSLITCSEEERRKQAVLFRSMLVHLLQRISIYGTDVEMAIVEVTRSVEERYIEEARS